MPEKKTNPAKAGQRPKTPLHSEAKKTTNKKTKNGGLNAKQIKKKDVKTPSFSNRRDQFFQGIMLPQRVITQIATEVAAQITRRDRHEEVKLDHPIFLDTSAIIDGRIFGLIEIGVFTGSVAIIEGVLEELKNIADSKDEGKKERGRQGMAMLEKIRLDKKVAMHVIDDSKIKKPVDERLIYYAKKYNGKLLTCDFNLSKKGQLNGVTTLNIYEIANVVKTIALPGETFFVKVVQKGKGERQGVGYLPDGTMIVVEEGDKLMEKTVRVLITRVIQTEQGKIFFGRVLA